MKAIERGTLVLLVSAVGAALMAASYLAVTPSTSNAAPVDSMGLYDASSVSPQVDGEPPSTDGDTSKVEVQAWTVMAAGGAAALFLLLFFVRIALGRVPPPPPQEDAVQH